MTEEPDLSAQLKWTRLRIFRKHGKTNTPLVIQQNGRLCPLPSIIHTQ